MPNDALVVHSLKTITEMEADKALADEIKLVSSALRQAVHGLQIGKYATFEDAMEATCGFRPLMLGSTNKVDSIDWGIVSIRHDAKPF